MSQAAQDDTRHPTTSGASGQSATALVHSASEIG